MAEVTRSVDTNSISLCVIEELVSGALPDTGVAEKLEPNDITTYGAEITTTARTPISNDRQNRKGTITDFSSEVAIPADLTVSHNLNFAEGIFYSTWRERPHWWREGKIAAEPDKGGFDVQDLPQALPVGALVVSRGWTSARNNGVKVVVDVAAPPPIVSFSPTTIFNMLILAALDVSTQGYLTTMMGALATDFDGPNIDMETTTLSTTVAPVGDIYVLNTADVLNILAGNTTNAIYQTQLGNMSANVASLFNDVTVGIQAVLTPSPAPTAGIPVEGALVQEDSTDSTSLMLCGLQAPEGDLSINEDGNLVSASNLFADYPFEVGEAIYIGGLVGPTRFASEQDHGLARIRAVASNLLILDKRQQNYVADNGAGKTIQVYIGWFIRNVAADDPRYKARSYSFELDYPGLADDGVGHGYEYSVGNTINTWELSMPLNDKAEATVTTFGQDTLPIVEGTERKQWTVYNPLFTEAFSTPNDFLRLRIQKVDETGLSTFFKDATITINNNAGGENVLGKLGPMFTNAGQFEVSIDSSVVFTNKDVTYAIRNNCTVSCDMCLANGDGALYVDIPSMTLGDGSKEFPTGEKVKIGISADAFKHDELGYTVSETYFPFLPTARALC